MTVHRREKQQAYERVYIGVYSYTSPEGMLQPRRIRWVNGQEWEVDKVLDVRPAAARKAGGLGTRFLVRIGRAERALFQDMEGRWFVEGRVQGGTVISHR